MTDSFVGIDVSESGLRLAVHQSDYRFECALDPQTNSKVIHELKLLLPKLVALAAGRTGTEIPLAAALYAAGGPTIVSDAQSVRKLTRQQPVEPDCGKQLPPFASLKHKGTARESAVADNITELLQRRAQLVELLASESACEPGSSTRSEIASHVFSLERRIAAIDFQLKRGLREAGVWRVRRQVFQSPTAIAIVSVALGAAAALLVVPLWIVRFSPLLAYSNHLARGVILC